MQLLAQAELFIHVSHDCGLRVGVSKTHAQGTHTQDTALLESTREGELHTGGLAPARGLGARTYPVIHQKVILERKEALDSGQGFYGERAQGAEPRGNDRLNFSSMPAPGREQPASLVLPVGQWFIHLLVHSFIPQIFTEHLQSGRHRQSTSIISYLHRTWYDLYSSFFHSLTHSFYKYFLSTYYTQIRTNRHNPNPGQLTLC